MVHLTFRTSVQNTVTHYRRVNNSEGKSMEFPYFALMLEHEEAFSENHH